MSTCCNSSLAAWPDPRSTSVAGSIRYRCHQRHYYYPLPIFILITLYDRIFYETWTTWMGGWKRRNVRMMMSMMAMMMMTRTMTIRRATQDHSHGHVLLLDSGMLSFYCCSFTDHSFLYKYSFTELELQPSTCSGNSSNKDLSDAGEIVVKTHAGDSLSLSQLVWLQQSAEFGFFWRLCCHSCAAMRCYTGFRITFNLVNMASESLPAVPPL